MPGGAIGSASGLFVHDSAFFAQGQKQILGESEDYGSDYGCVCLQLDETVPDLYNQRTVFVR